MTDKNMHIKRAGAYYLAGIALVALSIVFRGEIFLTAILCAVAAGFMLAGHLLWKYSVYPVLLISAALLYLAQKTVLETGLLFLFLVGVVLFCGYSVIANKGLSGTVAITTVATAVLLVAFFAAYSYISSGVLHLDVITQPLQEASRILDDEIYEMAHQLYSGYPAEQLDELVSAALSQKDMMIDTIILYMPGLIASFIMVSSYLAQTIAKRLTAKSNPGLVSTERLTDLTISRIAAGTFILSLILGTFISGSVAGVFLNYVFILSTPLFIAGVVCAYRFLTRNITGKGMRVFVGVVIAVTCIIPYVLFIDFSTLYIILGVIDSFTNWRARFKNANGGLNA